MNKMQIFAKALLEQIEVARVRQLSGLQESYTTKYADTARAISIFQKYAGLDQTGQPDPKTMSTIKMVAEVEGMGIGDPFAASASNSTRGGPKPGTVGTGSGGQLVSGDGTPVNQGASPPAAQPKVTPASALAAAKAPATSLSGDNANPEAELDSTIEKTRADQAPEVPAYMPGNSSSTPAAPAAAAPSTPAAKPVPNPGADTGMTDRNPYDDDALAKERLDAHQKQQVKYSDQAAAPAATPAATPAAVLTRTTAIGSFGPMPRNRIVRPSSKRILSLLPALMTSATIPEGAASSPFSVKNSSFSPGRAPRKST